MSQVIRKHYLINLKCLFTYLINIELNRYAREVMSNGNICAQTTCSGDILLIV